MTLDTLKDSALVALTGLVAGALTAAAITVTDAQSVARHWYGLHPGGSARVSYLHVLATNLRVCSLALLGAPLLACWPATRRALDALLALVLLINAALVGGALSAYGTSAQRPRDHACPAGADCGRGQRCRIRACPPDQPAEPRAHRRLHGDRRRPTGARRLPGGRPRPMNIKTTGREFS